MAQDSKLHARQQHQEWRRVLRHLNWNKSSQCKAVRPGHSVQPKIRPISVTDLITILRYVLSFKTVNVVTVQNTQFSRFFSPAKSESCKTFAISCLQALAAVCMTRMDIVWQEKYYLETFDVSQRNNFLYERKHFKVVIRPVPDSV